MPTLNRFPLLGLWAKEAARRAGYRRDEAESLGHAYAVLYAIRASRRPKTSKAATPGQAAKKPAPQQTVRFGGDQLAVTYADGHVRGKVGGDKPQTPDSFRAHVAAKFPGGYHDRLRQAFRALLATFPPRVLKDRTVYDVYDRWKKACGVGRLVNLDRLLKWCQEETARRTHAVKKARKSAAASP